MLIQQYILTRFNLRIFARDKHANDCWNEAWLKHRFALFERYCLPGVLAQTEREFCWILLMDEHTPEAYRAKLKALAAQCPQIRPVWVKSTCGCQFVRVFQEVVASHLASLAQRGIRPDWITTTYLDNDDALSTDYLREVKSITEHLTHDSFITFTRGLQYFERWNICTRIRYRNNHFLTLAEQPQSGQLPKTVYCLGGHSMLFRQHDLPILEIRNDSPVWMEVVHGRNVVNDVIMRRRTPLEHRRDILRERFHVDVETAADARRIFYTRYIPHYLAEVWKHLCHRITRHT